eukprot:TRINITY_DN42666_c0_g1_i1.p2 TRINITY_DN42666_c0_g1~~TRINITY_DN42666_c0_g1_i1.p2  ORF type:complete len:122 (+),score=19.65 TRINITY_DN42666_c0_g1_i1:27-368(+)
MDSLETEQPSMRFTKNVMDAIDGMEVAPVGKQYVNPWVIKGIAAVLALCMLVSLYVVFSSANTLPDYGLNVNTTKLPEHFSLYILGINIVLLLILAERWLSSKKRIQDLQDNA